MRTLAVAVKLAVKILGVVLIGIITIVGALCAGILDGLGRKPSRRRYNSKRRGR